MNNRSKWVAGLKNGWLQNTGLALSLLLFTALFAREVLKQLHG
jgi:hypothetical protein